MRGLILFLTILDLLTGVVYAEEFHNFIPVRTGNATMYVLPHGQPQNIPETSDFYSRKMRNKAYSQITDKKKEKLQEKLRVMKKNLVQWGNSQENRELKKKLGLVNRGTINFYLENRKEKAREKDN